MIKNYLQFHYSSQSR